MKKVILVSFLLSTLCLFGNTAEKSDGVFETDFRDTASLQGAFGGFPVPQKLFFEKSKSGSGRALIVRRGAFIPTFMLKKPLANGEDYGYSFDVTRLNGDSSLCCGFFSAKNKSSGLIWYMNDGRLMFHNGKTGKYEPTGIKLEPEKTYHVSVSVNSRAGTASVEVNGKVVYRGQAVFTEGLDRFTFAEQMPVNNRSTIENFRLWRGAGMAAADAPAYAEMLETDFRDTASLQGAIGGFPVPQKLFFEKSRSGSGRALIVRRGAFIPTVMLKKPLTKDEDYGYSFDVTRLNGDSSLCCGFFSAKNKNSAVIWYMNDGRLMLFSGKTTPKYEFTGIRLEPEKTYHVSVSVNSESGVVTVEVKGKGVYHGQTAFPDGLDRFTFAEQMPVNNRSAIENFRLYRKKGKIVCKENGARNAEVKTEASVSHPEQLAFLTDGKLDEAVQLPEKAMLEIVLPKRIQTHAVQIFGGSCAYRRNPSGGCAPKSYRVEGLCNGAWTELAKAEDAPDVCKQDGLADRERFLRHDFKSMPIDRIRVFFFRSHDTGKRFTGAVPAGKRNLFLREIEFLTDRDVVQRFQISSLLAMEFRLPVYRNADRAVLTIRAANSPLTPKQGTMTITDPQGKIVRTRKISWKSGSNALVIDDLGKCPAGRYMVTVDTEGYQFKRLLRLERIAEIKAPGTPAAMTGKKLFFTPDRYTFAECRDLDVAIGKTELIEQVRTPSPDKLLLFGTKFYRAEDGRYVVSVLDADYKGGMFAKHTPRHMASKSLTGPFAQIGFLPVAQEAFSPEKAFRPALFPRPPKGTKMELYDPARHGRIELGNLSYFYSYGKEDLGCITAAPRHYYVTGRTGDGKFVLMTGKALFHDFSHYGENDFDDGFMTNDNFGGMWLSPDGKECFWAQGQTMRRSEPYAIPYDNLQTGVRMMTVYSTRDGIHWQLRNTVTAPDEQDTAGAQHYGLRLMQLADGNLFLGQLYSYDATAQQIYIDLVYSRDGVEFFRFKDRTPFVRSFDPKDWYFGHVFLNENYIREGKFYYQQACYCTSLPHFSGEIVLNVPGLAQVTGEMFRRRFEDRNLSTGLPYFEKAGGYEGLAELARHSYYAAGVVKFRADGWFALKAGAKEGFFQTQPMTAKGQMTANAEVAKDGYIELELCDRTGKVLQKRRIAGDGLEIPAFGKLPDGAFYLRGRMKNAKLYTLNFNPIATK